MGGGMSPQSISSSMSGRGSSGSNSGSFPNGYGNGNGNGNGNTRASIGVPLADYSLRPQKADPFADLVKGAIPKSKK